MKTPLLTFLLIFTTISATAQYGWFPQSTGTNSLVGGIDFIDQDNGMAVGFDNLILKTTNGGTNWQNVSSPGSNTYHKIAYRDENRVTVVGSFGKVIYSSNAGLTWNDKSFSTFNLNRVRFIEDENGISDLGFIVGVNGTILRTTNGGDTWSPVSSNTSNILFDVWFASPDVGYISGDYVILKTVDRGETWTVLNNVPHYRYFGLSFADENNGIIVGGQGFFYGGVIFKTNDGGTTWVNTAPISFYEAFTTATFENGNYIIAGEFGRVLMSPNMGNNWLFQNTPTNVLLHDIAFVNNDTGYISGANGTILKTTTMGLTGLEPVASGVPSKFQLYQNYPNPFNPETTLRFDIAERTVASLVIFNVSGKEVKRLLSNEEIASGSYLYNWNAAELPSGVYFARLITNEYSNTIKLNLVK